MKGLFALYLILTFTHGISQCDGLQFDEIGFAPAYCRTASYQTGNGVVYASAKGGTTPYEYSWTNLQTGQVAHNTTWGGLNVGQYMIKVVDSIGCVLTETVKVDSVNPEADFLVKNVLVDSFSPGLPTVSIVLQNSSIHTADYWSWDPMLSYTTFYWNQDDDTSWTSAFIWDDFTAEFDNIGPYQVCLIASNKNGCLDTTCKLLDVVPPLEDTPEVNLSYSSLSGEVTAYLNIPHAAWFKLFYYDATIAFEVLLEPGYNSFNLPSGNFIYQITDELDGALLLSGTLIVV